MSGTDRQVNSNTLPGDPDEAIRLLFERHQSKVFNVCLRLLSNREEAEDIAQDVFVKAHQALETFRGEADHGTWLYRIAVNLSLNRQRRLKRLRWFSLDGLADSLGGAQFMDRDRLPGEALEESELELIVQEAINRLPERQRVALILSRYEGLSYQAIAQAMSSTVPSIESLLHRAKLNLAKGLRPHMEDLRPG
ncbi:MAG: RNA polymerase sigma factor [Candidatus Latescibacteria bacterium]|jgi:RNA polymerase sigma-70 factor, ECF subfamily|nr:RNA polymerase sigma factor [Candidatus Latescibacterota bacterium]